MTDKFRMSTLNSKEAQCTRSGNVFKYITVFIAFAALVGCTPHVTSTDIPHVLGGFHGGKRPWFTDMKCYCMPADGVKGDSIRFVRADTDDTKKPVFLSIQGSLPMPTIVDYGQGLYDLGYDTHLYFREGPLLDSILIADYHIVIVSQPYTPVIAPREKLGDYGAYYPNGTENGFDRNYRLHHQAEIYTDRICKVIDYLMTQDWVDKDSIYVYGHSQGAYIAPLVAARNEHVAAIGISGLGPLGGTLTDVLENRILALRGEITEEEAWHRHLVEYSNWAYCRDSTDLATIDKIKGDLPSTYLSYGHSHMELIATLKQPVFCAYGTKDLHAITCDWLPLYFITHHKTNYEMIAYKGRGHNFEPLDDGATKSSADHMSVWQGVTRSFVEFVRDMEHHRGVLAM